MPDAETPAKPKELTTSDYVNGVNTTLKLMRFDAQIHDASFLPAYNYNVSFLKQAFESLPAGPGVPPAIAQQVKDLEGGFKDTVRSMMKSEFKEPNFKSPLDALQTSITAAKTTPAAGQDNAALDQLAEAIKKIQDNGHHKEFEQAERALRLQNELNSANAFTAHAIQNGPYKSTPSSYYANDWVNESVHDQYSKEQLGQMTSAGVALSTQGPLHNGADGIYSKPDSKYKVQKSTNENGNSSYQGTYSHVPKGVPRTVAEELIGAVALLVRFYGSITLIIPAIELVSCCISLAVTAGKSTGPTGLPFSQMLKFHTGLFDKREKNAGDEARAEIEVARNIGKERGITFNVGESQSKSMNTYDLEKLTVYIDEMKKRGGYEPGDPPRMSKEKEAMDFQLSAVAETKLRSLSSAESPTPETMKMVKTFYASQNEGSMKGFDESKYKEYILREIKGLRDAFAPLRGPGQEKAQSSTITPTGNSSTITPVTPGATSVITPVAPTATSVITPVAATATSTISPSAPPMEDTPQRQAAAAMLIAAAKEGGVILKAGNLHEVVAEAMDKLDNYKDLSDDWVGQKLKQDVDIAVKEMPQSEIVEMEALGELNNYRDFCEVRTVPLAKEIEAVPKAAKPALGRLEPLEGKPGGADAKTEEPAPSTTARPK